MRPSEPPTTTPGGRRLGRYVLGVELGRGGMGVVYRATDEHLRRAVAIKTLLVGQERDVEARERFRREAEAAARLRHPGIVAVHEVGAAEDGSPFMVMDLIEGASLATRLAEGTLPLEEAVRVVRDVARAVAHAHAQGDLADATAAIRVLRPEGAAPGALRWPLAWSPSGTLLRVGRGVLELDLDQGVFRRAYGDTKVTSLAVSANGNVATGSSDGWLHVWTHSGGAPAPTPFSSVAAHAGPIREVAFSTDGGLLATLGEDSRVRAWSQRCALAATITFDARPLDVGFMADRRLAVHTSDGVVRAYDLEGMASQSHTKAVLALTCSPESATVASACGDASLSLWLASGEESPTTARRITLPDPVTALVAEDATHLFVGLADGTLARVDLEQQQSVRIGAHGARVQVVERAGRGRLLSAARELCLWDLETTPPRALWTAGHPAGVTAVAVDLARGRVASACLDGVVRLWDLGTGAAGPVLDSQVALRAISFLPDGRVVAGNVDGDLRVWDALGETPAETIRAHDGVVEDVKVSADGALFATGGADGVIRLWSVEKLEVVADLRRHRGPVRAVTFTPEGHWLVSGGEDRTVVWWPLRTIFDTTRATSDVLREAQEATGLVIGVEQGEVDPSPSR